MIKPTVSIKNVNSLFTIRSLCLNYTFDCALAQIFSAFGQSGGQAMGDFLADFLDNNGLAKKEMACIVHTFNLGYFRAALITSAKGANYFGGISR